jgi:hypothetical protein
MGASGRTPLGSQENKIIPGCISKMGKKRSFRKGVMRKRENRED